MLEEKEVRYFRAIENKNSYAQWRQSKHRNPKSKCYILAHITVRQKKIADLSLFLNNQMNNMSQ